MYSILRKCVCINIYSTGNIHERYCIKNDMLLISLKKVLKAPLPTGVGWIPHSNLRFRKWFFGLPKSSRINKSFSPIYCQLPLGQRKLNIVPLYCSWWFFHQSLTTPNFQFSIPQLNLASLSLIPKTSKMYPFKNLTDPYNATSHFFLKST